MKTMNRRHSLRLAGGLALAAGLAGWRLPAHAQSSPSRLAVMSMAGQDITLVQSDRQVGSRLPPRRESLPMGGGVLDQQAMLALDKQARAYIAADRIELLSAQGSMWSELQRDALAGDSGMKDMVATVTDVARRRQCSHALVLMKHRGVAKLRLERESIGHGMLEGLGFYVDTTIETVDAESREQSIGVLAPYAYLKLLYIDANQVSLVRSAITEASTSVAPQMGDMRHPWDALGPHAKAKLLTSLVDRELAHLVPRVLGTGS